MTPAIAVVNADALEHPCDVLIVKYAQGRHGVDEAVARALITNGHSDESMRPEVGGYCVVATDGAVGAREVMFAGVERLHHFGYREIRLFARKVFEDLAGRAPDTKRVALTMHGPGYGLDEREAFEALIAGVADAVRTGDVPASLTHIDIVERDAGRARRLERQLDELQPTSDDNVLVERDTKSRPEIEERLRSAGYASDSKPHVFVAMPFEDEMSDHYHYGIYGAVNAAGYLCERLAFTAFIGDVVDRIKDRIASAALVVADLSGANANVYLEVGYAWGVGKPVVLVVSDADELKFDIRGQRCLTYGTIRELEEKLREELASLQAAGVIP